MDLQPEEKDILYLEDGRKLGFTEYGDTSGFPIIALHGTPGSRIWFEQNDPISERLKIRLITVDRPGYGLSDRKPNRKIVEFNDDINQLIKHLKIKAFSIFGVSGGGAYALAFACTNHPYLYQTGLVASVQELKNGKAPADMCKPNRIGFFLAKRIPWILRFSYRQQKTFIDKNPDKYIASIRKNVGHLCPSDQEILMNTDAAQSMIVHLREAFRMYADEAVNELKLLGGDWGLDITKINAPVQVWHGKEDTLSPISGIKELIQSIPNITTNFIENKGHFLDEDEDLWKDILGSLKK